MAIYDEEKITKLQLSDVIGQGKTSVQLQKLKLAQNVLCQCESNW